MFRNRNKEIVMSQIDYHPNYQSSSDYSNTNSLPSTLGVNTNPSDGDVIVRVVRNAGTFDLSINMSYHSH